MAVSGCVGGDHRIHSQLQFSPTEGRKKSVNKQEFQKTIELTIDDFPLRGKKTQPKPKSKLAKKPKEVNEPETENFKKRKAKLAANQVAVDQAPRYATRNSTRAAAVNGAETGCYLPSTDDSLVPFTPRLVCYPLLTVIYLIAV
ncbi:hypothetical protein B0H11DRAFT_2183248 [Mycena galericulata]|nr:hypothetical protein B0H11DRAFT_2183248 [Mycena galericulata]